MFTRGVSKDSRTCVIAIEDPSVQSEAIDARVVVRFRADEDVRVVNFRQVAQDLRDPLGGQLARSARTRSVVDQALLPAEEQHGAWWVKR